jgi:hypothetical protein
MIGVFIKESVKGKERKEPSSDWVMAPYFGNGIYKIYGDQGYGIDVKRVTYRDEREITNTVEILRRGNLDVYINDNSIFDTPNGGRTNRIERGVYLILHDLQRIISMEEGTECILQVMKEEGGRKIEVDQVLLKTVSLEKRDEILFYESIMDRKI